MQSQTSVPEHSFEHALQGSGWKIHAGGNVWKRRTPRGMAQVRHVNDRGTWRHFELSGGALPKIEHQAILSANRHLAGPLKFVTLSGNRAVCRLDLPATVSSEWDWASQEFDAIERPFDSLAQAIYAVVSGEEPVLASADRCPERTSGLLADAGYSVSVDGMSVQVHLNHCGIYRQVHVGQVGLSAEIARLDGYGPDSRQAALLLVHQANQRLPLVRYSLANDGPAIVRAEVYWGLVPISGAWLNLSLECIDAAIALTARELEAVRDPQLGKLAVTMSTA